MTSAPSRGKPGLVDELGTAVDAEGVFSLLRRKRSSLPPPLVGMRQ
jgi:hypothetical protein